MKGRNGRRATPNKRKDLLLWHIGSWWREQDTIGGARRRCLEEEEGYRGECSKHELPDGAAGAATNPIISLPIYSLSHCAPHTHISIFSLVVDSS